MRSTARTAATSKSLTTDRCAPEHTSDGGIARWFGARFVRRLHASGCPASHNPSSMSTCPPPLTLPALRHHLAALGAGPQHNI